MDSCTASTLRTILMLAVVAAALMGLWTMHDAYTCRAAPAPADRRRCTAKALGVTVGVLAAGLLLTTLVIVRARRVAAGGQQQQQPSTTDLMQNIV